MARPLRTWKLGEQRSSRQLLGKCRERDMDAVAASPNNLSDVIVKLALTPGMEIRRSLGHEPGLTPR